MNIVILHGRLTADPTIRQSNSGKSIVGFSVAVDGYKDKDGNKQTDFIRCTAFGQTADMLSRYWTKGKEIALEGNLRQNDYTDNNGTKHNSYQVVVNRVHFCGSKSDNQQTGQQTPQFGSVPAPQDNGLSVSDLGEFEEILSDGEVPF
jgi:single-strand DNA-binding protein